MKTAACLLVVGAGVARADQVVIMPAVQPAAQLAPVFAPQVQDLSVGYRHEESTGFSGNGFALRAVIGVPGLMLDGEGEMSGAWGYRGTELVGHAQISLALRLVLNKPGRLRPFIVAAPLVDITRNSSSDDYALGAAGGVGLDVLVGGPGLVTVDVRGGQAWNIKSQDWSGWQLLATVSIGLHVEPGER